MTVTNEPGIGHLSVSTSRRLEILKEIEGTFPGLPTEQVLDLARWVEGNGTPANTLQPEEVGKFDDLIFNDLIAHESRKAGVSSPRTWTHLDAIPSTVKAITDRDGDRAEPRTLNGKRAWFFTAAPLHGVEVSPNHGQFTEVLENEWPWLMGYQAVDRQGRWAYRGQTPAG